MSGQHGLEILLISVIGLLFGSFATALSWRAARGLPWLGGRSYCPACKEPLGVRDLIPVLSWVAMKGRCRRCGQPVSARYPLIELAVMAACLGIYAVGGLTIPSLLTMAAVPFLTALFLIDLEQMILPDLLLAIVGGLGVLYVGVFLLYTNNLPDFMAILKSHAGGAVLYAGVIWLVAKAVSLVLKKEAMGFGDVKFFAVAGLWLGALWLPWFMVMAGLTGLVFGGSWRLCGRGEVFPFGPVLILAFYACLLLQGMGFDPAFGL